MSADGYKEEDTAPGCIIAIVSITIMIVAVSLYGIFRPGTTVEHQISGFSEASFSDPHHFTVVTTDPRTKEYLTHTINTVFYEEIVRIFLDAGDSSNLVKWKSNRQGAFDVEFHIQKMEVLRGNYR